MPVYSVWNLYSKALDIIKHKDDLLIRQPGFIVFNNHLQLVVTGIDLFDTPSSVSSRLSSFIAQLVQVISGILNVFLIITRLLGFLKGKVTWHETTY